MSSGGTGHMLAGDADDVIRCRDRELLALRSLLRSVTGKLEEAAEMCEPAGTKYLDEEDTQLMGQLIDSALEALS
jgi:hypothetical protein